MQEVVDRKSYAEDPYLDQLESQIVKKPKQEHFTDSLLFFVLFFLFFIIAGVVIGIFGAVYFKAM